MRDFSQEQETCAKKDGQGGNSDAVSPGAESRADAYQDTPLEGAENGRKLPGKGVDTEEGPVHLRGGERYKEGAVACPYTGQGNANKGTDEPEGGLGRRHRRHDGGHQEDDQHQGEGPLVSPPVGHHPPADSSPNGEDSGDEKKTWTSPFPLNPATFTRYMDINTITVLSPSRYRNRARRNRRIWG